MQNQDKIALADLAFSKFAPIDEKESTEQKLKSIFDAETGRLSRSSYPLSENPEIARVLKNDSDADAVIVQGDRQLPNERRSTPVFWGFKPIYPDDVKFWTDELKQCVDLRIARLAGGNPDDFYGWPLIMKEARVDGMNAYTLKDIAAAVNGEYPASIQQTFVEWMLEDNKALRRDDRKLILDLGQEFRSNRDFIGVQCRIAAINTWSFETVAPVNFMLKWNHGMPRPEEVAWLITEDKIEDDIRRKFGDEAGGVVDAIVQMGLTRRKDFTAYNKARENGSPTHPSFPAMHSAASTIGTWMPALFDLTPAQYEQALLTDYGTAMGRTVAGVHYPMDNIAGLSVGQRIIRDKLPAFASERYEYPADRVEARLDALAFDWKDFDSKALTVRADVDGGTKTLTVREFLQRANATTAATNLLGAVEHHY